MRTRTIAVHAGQALMEGALVALLVTGLVAGTAFAGKPGGGGTTTSNGTIKLVLMDGATEAHYGARVTFNVATTATAYPFVHLLCTQGGALVLDGRRGFFPTSLDNQWFYLGPTPAWQGGAADCRANLEMYTKRGYSVLTSTTFHVYP